MNRLFLLLSITITTLFSLELPMERAALRAVGTSAEVNAKIMQLSDSRQSIMSLVDGHIENYFVKPGEKVKVKQKIAKIDSIMLSKMTAESLSLKQQYSALGKNHEASRQLYEKGMLALQDLNRLGIEKDAMRAELNTLESQLLTLGINTKTLKKASSEYILYAHSDGVVNEILQPLHSVVGRDTPIVSIVAENAVYAKAYVPLRYADKLKIGQKAELYHNGRQLSAHLVQLLPEVDPQTQRVVTLFAIDDRYDDLYINAYVPLKIYFDTDKEYVTVKRSALSFFQNEWVVFVPKAHAGEEHHDDHEGHEQDPFHAKESAHDEEHEGSMSDADENEGHEGHDEQSKSAYEARVVKIIVEDGHYAAIKGLHAGEEYVSDKSYYVKSMLLKSSLGGHGH